MANKPFWEESGFTDRWYWDQHRLRGFHHTLSDGDLMGIVARHGDRAFREIESLAASGNYRRYAEALPMLEVLRPTSGHGLPIWDAARYASGV